MTGSQWSGGQWSGGKLQNDQANPATQHTTDNGFGTQYTQAMTKHDQLIRLVTGMIRPNSWDGSGGNGKIEFYDIGAALVVNQTGDVIQEVADLLESLRRLQDLAVAVEIRFVSLSETFFERMGVDFTLNVHTQQHQVRAERDHRHVPPGAVHQQLQRVQGHHHRSALDARRRRSPRT